MKTENPESKTLSNNQDVSETKVSDKTHTFTVVAIGASAGGLEAVTELLKNLSPTTDMAYIYVQHLSPDHKSMLTSILSKITAMKVQEIDDMEKMEPNNVYVIPHDKEIKVVDGHIKLLPRPKTRRANLSIDLLFASLAETHKENVIGIVLSGSASDGTRGLKEIKQAGGITFAQDDSAKFSSMPQSAIAEGVVDFVLSPAEIGQELVWISKHPLLKRNIAKTNPEDELENNNPDLLKILDLLYKHKNVDFSIYKMNTIKRRMLRRMFILKLKTTSEYKELLSQKNEELETLYQDLLINVTEFFRDTEAFLMLKKSVFPKLLKSKTGNETLRIWVAACATGEEVYSMAMSLLEIQQANNTDIPVQIFASDLSVDAIALARNGEYSINQLKNVSPKRLQQFFLKSKDKYRITKQLRDMCIFAQHNILNDPPFSRMDFISCRNFLIYLDHNAQKKAIATFHYALNDNGFLLLGKSETIGSNTQFFTILNKQLKCYVRKKNSGTHRIPDTTRYLPTTSLEINPKTVVTKKLKPFVNNNFGDAFDAILLEKYVPASVVINYDLEILQFRGQTAPFLENPTGKASFNILKMAHIEINFELRNAIHHAIKTKSIVKKTGIEMNREVGGNILRIINLEVVPLKVEGNEPLLIVIFTGMPEELIENSNSGNKSTNIAKDRRIKKLEEEIAAARVDMNSITRDQEAANEELQSANEEVISSNEELQSLNEELETSKEEIESTNEELITSNQELHARIQQVEELYNYYETIIATVHEPVLILDRNIRVKSANKSFCKMFLVKEDDSIGISLYRLGNNQWNIPALREQLEDVIPKNNRFHDFEVEQEFPIIGKRTLLLNAHRIFQKSQNEELIVLTIVDITEVKKLAIELEVKQKAVLERQLESEKNALKMIEDSNKRYNWLLMKSPFAFAIMKGKDMIVTLANFTIKEFWGKGQDVEGKSFLEIFPELNDSEFPILLQEVFKTGVPYIGNEFPAQIVRNGKSEMMYFNFVYQPYYEVDETISGITIIASDVTPQVHIKNELLNAKNDAELKTQIAEDAVQAKQQFLSNMSHEIRTPMNAIVGFTNVILKTQLDDSQKQYINAIKVSGDALIVLINDILDLAKVDAGKMTFEKIPFNLLNSISGIIQLFEIKIKEKNLKFELVYDKKIPEIIVGDPMRLRQIILNLMSNSVKFTEKGKILIQVDLITQDTKKINLEFKITDTGIGIATDKIDAVFNNFEQAHAESSISYGGTGLGLAIVKKLLENQGGKIALTSKLGFGSMFTFDLDFMKHQSESKLFKKNMTDTNIPKTNIKLKNIKVLVAEDVVLNQLLVKIILKDFEVDIAENGKIAIEKLQNHNYDLVLMDLHMPEMNGFEATTFIRNEMKSQIPIIALTADVTQVDIDKCTQVGMTDYVSKPIDENLLFQKIVKVLNFKN
ncbi:MAG: response regulator [Flavobacterium sp.]|nr:response regulator [Flavobacterium sp.]